MTDTAPIASTNPDDDLFIQIGEMKMVTHEGQRLAVIRTEEGVHALDNACPHQGYGLVTGELGVDGDGDAVVTCQWHNWKFRARDGVCTVGEENVTCHRTHVDDRGHVHVTITSRSAEEQRRTLWPSLRSALANHYVGQIARDTVRLLDIGAAPAEVMAAAVTSTVERTEDGVDHEVALAADCLALAEARDGDECVLPLVVGLSGLAEQTRGRPAVTANATDPDTAASGSDLVALIEQERLDEAMTAAAALPVHEARAALVEAASRHHLGYGHGVIYTQKVFELLERTGPGPAPALLSQLARSLTLMTREDTLPYMRAATRAIGEVDLDRLASAQRTTPTAPAELLDAFLQADEAPIAEAVAAAEDGLGVEGLIDIASLGSAHRMLRYDPAVERDTDSNFGWLQISHGLTHANAARWALANEPGPAAARIALHAIWLMFDTGRHERRFGLAKPSDHEELADEAPTGLGERLIADSLDDRGGSFIVVAHLVKTAVAAITESEATRSPVPLLATAAMIDGDRRERFVARAVAESVRFVRTGRPPQR